MNFDIPEGLTDLLQDFTVEILRNKPKDLVAFAAQYFNTLLHTRNKNSPQESSYNEYRAESGTGTQATGSSSSKYRAESARTETDDENEQLNTNNNHQHHHDDDDDDDEMGDIIDLPKTKPVGRRHSVAAEKYNPEEDDDDTPKIVHPKTTEQRAYLLVATKNIFMFRSLDPKQINEVIDAMFGRDAVEGDVIIEQGDDGDNFYVIESGVYDIYVNQNKVGSYNQSGSFGELALMYNMPRAATIKATTKGKLWALDRQTFKRIVVKSAFEKRKMYEQLLDNMPLFKSLSAYERMNVADALYSKLFKNNEEIIKQGDQATCMYFIEHGQVRIVRAQDGQSKEVKLCNKGQYFGELALLTKKPRAATAIAVGDDVKCAILDIDAFERLLGPCFQIMKKNIPDYEDALRKLFGEKFNISELR